MTSYSYSDFKEISTSFENISYIEFQSPSLVKLIKFFKQFSKTLFKSTNLFNFSSLRENPETLLGLNDGIYPNYGESFVFVEKSIYFLKLFILSLSIYFLLIYSFLLSYFSYNDYMTSSHNTVLSFIS